MSEMERLIELAVYGRFQQLLSEYSKDDKLMKHKAFHTQAVYEVNLMVSKFGVNCEN